MSIELLFWLVFVIGLLFSLYTNRAAIVPWLTNTLVFWLLFALLGWKVFGPVIHA